MKDCQNTNQSSNSSRRTSIGDYNIQSRSSSIHQNISFTEYQKLWENKKLNTIDASLIQTLIQMNHSISSDQDKENIFDHKQQAHIISIQMLNTIQKLKRNFAKDQLNSMLTIITNISH